MARDKIEGLTLIGPYGREKNITAAKQHGLQCTYKISLPMDFHGEKPLELTPDQIREQIGQQVKEAAGHPEIAWWYLGRGGIALLAKERIDLFGGRRGDDPANRSAQTARLDVRTEPPHRGVPCQDPQVP